MELKIRKLVNFEEEVLIEGGRAAVALAGAAESFFAFTDFGGPGNTRIQIPLMDKNVVGRPHHRIGDRYQDLAELGAGVHNPASVKS